MRRTIFTRSQRDCRGKQACLRFSIEDADIMSIINLSVYSLRPFRVSLVAYRCVGPFTFHRGHYSEDTRLVMIQRYRLDGKSSAVVIIDVIRSTFFAPFPFPQPRLFLSRVAQMHRGKSFYLKARRRPSCLHLNCFGLNRSCASICRLLASPFSSSSLFLFACP